MTLKELYEACVSAGLKKDPRTSAELKKAARDVKKEQAALLPREKKYFDSYRLKHPYDDTRILYGNPDTEISHVLVGIDMEGPELLLADALRKQGVKIDAVIAHHPEGKALAGFYRVMGMQKNILEHLGIKAGVGSELLDERMGEVARSVSAANHMRAVDCARLLDIPFMCVHTPADNHVTDYLQKQFDRRKPRRLRDILNYLYTIPEYRYAASHNAGPFIMAGKKNDTAGKVVVDMTGGTEGSRRVFPRLSQAGVGTLVGMHLSEQHYKSIQKEHVHVVIAGHISSDTLGLNLMLDSVSRRGKLTITGCAGFKRIARR